MRVVALVIFILFPFLSKAHSTETEHTNPQSSSDSIHIYVSPQVTIVGIEHVYHGEIIIIIKEQKKIIAENSGALKRRSNPLVKEKSIERKAVEPQEKNFKKKQRQLMLIIP